MYILPMGWGELCSSQCGEGGAMLLPVAFVGGWSHAPPMRDKGVAMTPSASASAAASAHLGPTPRPPPRPPPQPPPRLRPHGGI